MGDIAVRHYGIKEQHSSKNAIEQAIERLRIVGYAAVESGYSADKQQAIAEAFERARKRQLEIYGGVERLKEIDEHNTIRAPLAYEDIFIELASNENILTVAEQLFGGSHKTGTYVLNQQNGIINPGGAGTYNQAAYHRDLPYQHFTTSRPVAINALYCIDPFTKENGATLVLPATHKESKFPSEAVVKNLAQPVEAPAGTFLVLDCMTYHSGGNNVTDKDRRAVNNVYTLPLIRQQIELASVMGGDRDISPDLQRLLGFDYQKIDSIEGYYNYRQSKLVN